MAGVQTYSICALQNQIDTNRYHQTPITLPGARHYRYNIVLRTRSFIQYRSRNYGRDQHWHNDSYWYHSDRNRPQILFDQDTWSAKIRQTLHQYAFNS